MAIPDLTATTRPTWWQRIGVTVLGIALIVTGLVLIVAQNKTVQKVAGTALKATPEGAAADLATSALE